MDLAVGVIIGGAFGKIVSSLANDILLPPISAMAGNTDLSQLKIELSVLRNGVAKAGESATGTVTSTPDSIVPDATENAGTIYHAAIAIPSGPIY